MNYYYYGIKDGKLKAFREDCETVFVPQKRTPVAIVEEGTWYDWDTRKPVAYEDGEMVYKYGTDIPTLIKSVE